MRPSYVQIILWIVLKEHLKTFDTFAYSSEEHINFEKVQKDLQ